jgi:hypothetical protein
MFPNTDPQFQLDLYHQRADELHREADAYRRARSASSAGRHRRFGRASRRPPQVSPPGTQ